MMEQTKNKQPEIIIECCRQSDGTYECKAKTRPAHMNEKHELQEMILEEAAQGNVVFSTIEGYAVSGLDEFIAQPIDGLLYDLNRSPEVVLTFIDDPKWVNDYAVYLVIKRLKEKLDGVGVPDG